MISPRLASQYSHYSLTIYSSAFPTFLPLSSYTVSVLFKGIYSYINLILPLTLTSKTCATVTSV